LNKLANAVRDVLMYTGKLIYEHTTFIFIMYNIYPGGPKKVITQV